MSDFNPGPGWRIVENNRVDPELERCYHWVGNTLTCWVKDADS